MNHVGSFFRSTIGRKVLMAVTGLILIGFVIGHLIGNLQVFSAPDKLNGYAHFLQSLGPLLWIARIGLIVAAVVHIWAAATLTLDSNRARTTPYTFKHTIRATLASRLMRWSGVVVLAFIVYHLAHFTFGAVQPASFKTTADYTMKADYHVAGFPVVHAGEKVHDVRLMVIRGFQSPVVSVFYIIAIGLLSVHLLHGFDSLFQTLGLRSHKWAGFLRGASVALCVAYFIFNVTIPATVLAGGIQP